MLTDINAAGNILLSTNKYARRLFLFILFLIILYYF